jgi:exonuclease SbcD
MRLLHTSDWHLGRTLYSKKDRQAEHSKFLDWLLAVIKEEKVDILIVAGDIFDSSAPANASLKIYYDFLLKVRNSGCSNVVITGGNHDSPSLLEAPKEVLSALNVKVVGKAAETIEDEVFTLTNERGVPLAVVCAVPFLRERDISRFAEGESYSDRSARIAENIRKHYEVAAREAEKQKAAAGGNIPVIATGHLSVAGGKTIEDDGVRETYVGSVEFIGSDIFPPIFDYVALGHFHIASKIGGNENIRYSGSPLPMGFGEAGQQKIAVLVEFENGKQTVKEIPIPVFQKIESIKGDKAFIKSKLDYLKFCGESVWLEIIYDGDELFSGLADWVASEIDNTPIEIIKIQNKQYLDNVLTMAEASRSLDDLDEFSVFDEFLAGREFPDEQKQELRLSYREIVNEIREKL